MEHWTGPLLPKRLAKRSVPDELHASRAAEASAKRPKHCRARTGKLRMPGSSAVQMLDRRTSGSDSACQDSHFSVQRSQKVGSTEAALLEYETSPDSFAEATCHSAGANCTTGIPSSNTSSTSQWSSLSRASLSTLGDDDVSDTDQDCTANDHNLAGQFLEACCAKEVVSAISKLTFSALLPIPGA
jgi:hypothetical protein